MCKIHTLSEMTNIVQNIIGEQPEDLQVDLLTQTYCIGVAFSFGGTYVYTIFIH